MARITITRLTSLIHWGEIPSYHNNPYICVYVYMCDMHVVCMYKRTYVCMYYVHTYVCTYICTYVCTYVCVCIGMYVYRRPFFVYESIHNTVYE